MNFYSSTEFLNILKEVYFSKQDAKINIVKFENKYYRTLFVNKKPILMWPFIDFLEELTEEEFKIYKTDNMQFIKYMPLISHGKESSYKWKENNLSNFYEPAPYINWLLFNNWEEYEEYVKQNRSILFADSRRQLRKLEKNFAKVEFSFHNNSTEAFDLCVKWKSLQCLKTGYIDLFANSLHVKLFKTLLNKNMLKVSTLSVDARIIAVLFNIIYEDHFYCWISAYDDSFFKYSPGRLLFEFVIKYSFTNKHKEFNFLIGGEAYKWHYVTNTRLIGEAGIIPFKFKLKRKVKKEIKKILINFPKTFQLLKRIMIKY